MKRMEFAYDRTSVSSVSSSQSFDRKAYRNLEKQSLSKSVFVGLFQ